jgi:hypothetical protein
VARRVLAALAGGEARNESDLLSYLLFDGSFFARLIEMGYADAEARATEIAELFSRDVQTEPVSGSS